MPTPTHPHHGPGRTPDDGVAPCCQGPLTSRRRFLQLAGATTAGAVVTSMTGSAFLQTAFASTATAEKVLVVVSLRGGADGLSMVVPHGDPAYAIARPNIGVPFGTLRVPDTMFGLHPGFEPLEPMWKDGRMAAVHAVGLPQPNRSHFEAMEAIEDADPGSSERRGWLNRLTGLDDEVSPIEAVNLGSPMVPTSLYGEAPVLAVSDLADMFIPSRENPEAYKRRLASLMTAWSASDDVLGRGARAAVAMSPIFEDLHDDPVDPQHEAVYPAGDLGRALAQTAHLVRADIGAEVVTIDTGTWDMHVGLGTVERGLMRTAVDELALGLAAFFKDLGDVGDRVTVVTISEFGRRLEENASRGLDHGYGNAMLLMGAGVRGGRYYGTWPRLGEGRLVDGDLAVTTDYRSVLTEVVRSRFGADASKVFPRFKPEPVGVMIGG